MTTTDGAQAYGFGMAQEVADPRVVRRIAEQCAIEGHGILPAGVDLHAPSVFAVGEPFHIPLQYDDFRPCISAKVGTAADAPSQRLEG